MPISKSKNLEETVAGNGLLHRRVFLAQGAALLGVGSANLLVARPVHGQTTQNLPPWMRAPGESMRGYGSRSRFEEQVQRTLNRPTGTGASRTPLEHLEGIITPNELHFERHHSGIPDIDPGAHRLLIHGLVGRPLIFVEQIGATSGHRHRRRHRRIRRRRHDLYLRTLRLRTSSPEA